MSALPSEDIQVGTDFLSELAKRADAEAVIDMQWGMALGSMLLDGWKIVPPVEYDQ